MAFENNSISINIESWFIPFDILMILSTALTVLLSIFFLIIIIRDKTCHTLPMLLVANSCLAELVYGSNMFSMGVFTLHNDFKQIQYQDSLCVFRGYMGYVVTVLQNYSYLLQAIYRYITVVYPTRIFWQSTRCQVYLICSTWIFGFVCPIPYILTGEIIYNVDNQICQMPFRFSAIMVYNAICLFGTPIPLIMLIYFKLVRYVREMSKNVTTANTLARAQRELKMVRRIVILVIGVITIGLPYTMLVVISFFITPPKYHFRIAYIFVDVSLAFVMIAILKFTDPLKTAVKKAINWRTNVVVPAIT
jgi:hypothetical protein